MFCALKKSLLYLPLLLISLLVTNTAFTAQVQQEVSPHNTPSLLTQERTIRPAPYKNYKNIIFDVGNVLLAWDPLKIAAKVRTELKDIEFDDNSILKFICSKEWERWDLGTISREEFATFIPAELDKNVFFTFLDIAPYVLVPIIENIEILKAVKARGYHVYILSNISYEFLTVKKKECDFFKLFDGEVFSCNEHVIKPDAAIYNILLQRYNLDPAECLFIDDLQKNIDAAKSLAIDGIVCSSPTFVKNELHRLGIL